MVDKSKIEEILNEYAWTEDPEKCLAAVQEDGYALQYVQAQTEAICLAAVQEDGYALQYVQAQTEAICLAAIQEDGDALQYVDRSILKKWLGNDELKLKISYLENEINKLKEEIKNGI